MSNLGNRRRVTGIIAAIQKVTTHMSGNARTGGRRWRRSRLRLNSEGEHGRVKWARNLVLVLAGMALSGRATVPTGSSVMVLPAQYKPFDVFRSEDFECRNWAAAQSGQPADAYNQNLAGGAVIGTLVHERKNPLTPLWKIKGLIASWQSQGESNPCLRRERAIS